MKMKVSELTQYLESIAPVAFQESYDNSGLIVGDYDKSIHKALISLDCTEEVVDEAIATGCDIIISHHPIVFKGLKRFNNNNYIEKAVIKAIKNDIALYAIHTNLDNVVGGVNTKLADKIGLQKQAILRQKDNILRKLTVYVPRSHVESVRQSMFDAGAGMIGDYDQCSYNTAGYGTFRPLEEANPSIGTIQQQERVEETKIEVVFNLQHERKILLAMFSEHPYEEVAYNIVSLHNNNRFVGSGIIGNLSESISYPDFLELLKDKLDLKMIRHTSPLDRPVQRVAVCGGSGSFLLQDAIRSGADVFVSADFKYHEFFDAERKVMIADIGHFESERFTQELLLELIRKKFANFAVQMTEIDTNPIKYFV